MVSHRRSAFAEQRCLQGTPVNTYVMKDSPTNFSLGEIVLKPDEEIRLYFTGGETSTVMGKAQLAILASKRVEQGPFPL